MQRAVFLVIPVHYRAFFAHVHRIVIHIPCRINTRTAQCVCKRPPLAYRIIVYKLNVEQRRAFLNVRHARLPKQIQHINFANIDVSDSVFPRVPEYAFYARSLLELVPPYIAVHLLISALLQRHRQNPGQRFCRLLVIACARQHIRLRIVVHRIRMLVCNGIKQPGAVRGIPAAVTSVQLPPVFIVHNPP